MPWSERTPRPRDPSVQHGMDLLGAAVRRRREALRLSQRELARRSGVHQSVISRLENGVECGVRWSRFMRLVHELGGLDFDLEHRRPSRPKPKSWRTIRGENLAREIADWEEVEARIRREQAEELGSDDPAPSSVAIS